MDGQRGGTDCTDGQNLNSSTENKKSKSKSLVNTTNIFTINLTSYKARVTLFTSFSLRSEGMSLRVEFLLRRQTP